MVCLHDRAQTGIIIADSPGMGKTISGSVFFARTKMNDPDFKGLLIVKNILMDQWKLEIESWTKLRVLTLPVPPEERVSDFFCSGMNIFEIFDIWLFSGTFFPNDWRKKNGYFDVT